MANQYPQVLKVFEHLKKTAGGTPAEIKPNEGEKFRFGWRTKDALYELFQLGDCLYFCGATEKHSGEDEKKVLELLIQLLSLLQIVLLYFLVLQKLLLYLLMI